MKKRIKKKKEKREFYEELALKIMTNHVMCNEEFNSSVMRNLAIQTVHGMFHEEFSDMKFHQLKRFVQKNTKFIRLDLVSLAKDQSFRRFYNELGKYDEFVVWLKSHYTNSNIGM